MPDQTKDNAVKAEFGLDHIADLSSLIQALINNAGAGIYLVQDGKFVYVNPFLEELSSYSRPELTGHNSLDFVHPDDREAVRKKAAEALKHQGNNAPAYEYRFIKKSGEIMWVIERVSSIEYNGRRAVLGSFMDINRRKLLEEALVVYGERYRNMLERMQDSYYELDLHGNFVFVNHATCQNLGYEWGELNGKNYRLTTPENELKHMFQGFNAVYKTGIPNPRFQHMGMRRNGELYYAETSIDLSRNGNGEIIGFKALSRDITDRKLLEEELSKSEEKYRGILEEMEDAYYEVDVNTNFVFCNDQTLRDTGYSREEFLSMNYKKVVPEEDAGPLFAACLEVFKTGIANKGYPHRIVTKTGDIKYVEAAISPMKNDHGEVIGFRFVSRDVSERKKLEQKLAEMATHDFLTGLPNRILLNDRFYVAVAHAHRSDSKLAVMSLDLDRFKAVNDTMGHSAGDELLKMVAIRLSYTLRSSDTVARIGGDEFVLLLQEIHTLEDATSIAEKIVESFKGPFVIEGHYLNISTSIGLAVYPDDGKDLDILMRKSDAAMYHSKKEGGNRFKVFSDSDRQELKY